MSAYVYRCYDAEAVLLYVGCAYNPHRRIRAHLGSRKTLASHGLQALMARYEVEGPYDTREAAEAAEKAAIMAEAPLLNRQHNYSPSGSDYTLLLYLRDRNIPLAAVGLHRCVTCRSLRRHCAPPGMCSDCESAQADGRLDEWVEFVAELFEKYDVSLWAGAA